MWVQDVTRVQGKAPQVVVAFSSGYWSQQVLDQAVRTKLRNKGITVSINLTSEEMANRQIIRQHPQFQAALKRMPAGAKEMWRLDACVLDTRWTPQSKVWTADSLAVAERMDVDLSADA